MVLDIFIELHIEGKKGNVKTTLEEMNFFFFNVMT